MAQNSPSTSLTLLDQLRAPNADAAWTKFERLYAPLLASWARRHGFHETDAADLAQEVLVKLTKQLPAYERQPGGSFRGWLYRITANTARDLRRNRATRALPTGDGLERVGAEPDFAEFEERDYRRGVLRRALELVRPEFGAQTWDAFRLLMIDERPVAEVAECVGLTPNAVYLARHRVLTRLRREVDGLLD